MKRLLSKSIVIELLFTIPLIAFFFFLYFRYIDEVVLSLFLVLSVMFVLVFTYAILRTLLSFKHSIIGLFLIIASQIATTFVILGLIVLGGPFLALYIGLAILDISGGYVVTVIRFFAILSPLMIVQIFFIYRIIKSLSASASK